MQQGDQTVLSLRPGGGRGNRLLAPRFDSSSSNSSVINPALCFYFIRFMFSNYVFTLFVNLIHVFIIIYIFLNFRSTLLILILNLLLLLASYKFNLSCDVLRRQIICLYVLHCGFITRFHFV
jgi:hypothetical protein